MRDLLIFAITFPGALATAILIPLLAGIWFCTPQAKRERVEWLLAFAALCQPAEMVAEWFTTRLDSVVPLKYDLYIYRIDGIFGHPSFHLGQYVYAHLWAMIVSSITYGLLPTAMFAGFAVSLFWGSRSDAVAILQAYLIMFFAIIPLYLVLPVCGPLYAFPHFPAMPGAVTGHLVVIHAAPNGVPSGHMAAALMVLWAMRHRWWTAIPGAAFAALTVVATMASGEHYAFDLICAVPYAAIILWVTHPVKSYSEQSQTVAAEV